MALGYAEVSGQFSRAENFGNVASSNARQLVQQLQTMAGTFAPPRLSDPGTAPVAPSAPNVNSLSVVTPIVFNQVTVPTESIAEPTGAVDIGAAPDSPTFISVDTGGLNLPTAPTAPTLDLTVTTVNAPSLGEFGLPALLDVAAPPPISITIPDAPPFVELTKLLPPTRYSYVAGAQYASELLTSVKATILSRMNGSTGVAPAVEQAIWDRARTRELSTAAANQAEVMRTAEARGLALPPGTLAVQLREAQRDYYSKMSEFSRDVAIKQADLEQSNAKAAIEQGIALEGKLIDYANSIEQRSFEAANELANNAVAIYNAQITEVRTLVDAYLANATIFKARAEIELGRIEGYKALIQAEGLKAEMNKVRIDGFRALIEASLAKVTLYRAQVDAQRTFVEIQQAKVGLFGEQVRAYQAQIGGEVARLEIPKVQAQINDSSAQVYRARVEGYAAAANVKNATARNQVDIYDAKVRALTAKFQGYSAQVQAEAARVGAIATTNSSILERDRALIQRDVAQYGQTTELFRANVGLYEAQTRVNLDRTRMASEQYLALRTLAADAAKVGAQVNAQLAASAFSTIHANAQIGTQENVNFQFSGETAGSAMPA